MSDEELDRFKQIDLRAYAQQRHGYIVDKRESSNCSTVLRNDKDDKLIVSRKSDGHYFYWSVRTPDDRGTIIDFIGHRTRMNLGGIRKELRDWLGTPQAAFSPAAKELMGVVKDRKLVEENFSAMRSITRHDYLENERAIPALALQWWRFEGRIKADQRGNAIFPHYDAEGLCGYEIKNRRFTGFAAGGSKGLWLSKGIREDNRLVVCESAIDALSHAVLDPNGTTRYASMGGKPNIVQPELLRTYIAGMREGSTVIAATDDDYGGMALASIIERQVERSGLAGVTFLRQKPEGFKDFNEQLKSAKRPALVRARMLEREPT